MIIILIVGSNLVCAKLDESVGSCMMKLLSRDIRHLPLLDDTKEIIGMLSIKDLIKVVVTDKNEMIRKMANLKVGEGAFFHHG